MMGETEGLILLIASYTLTKTLERKEHLIIELPSLKTSSALLNAFKHNIKDYCFREGNKKES